MLKGFREFVFRGNVIDLAVAFVVGAAFATLIKTVTDSLIQPIVGAILSLIHLDGSIGGTWEIATGYSINFTAIITAFIVFFLTLAILYMVFVAPMNKYRQLRGGANIDARPADVQLLEEIRDLLKAQAEGTK